MFLDIKDFADFIFFHPLYYKPSDLTLNIISQKFSKIVYQPKIVMVIYRFTPKMKINMINHLVFHRSKLSFSFVSLFPITYGTLCKPFHHFFCRLNYNLNKDDLYYSESCFCCFHHWLWELVLLVCSLG